MPEFAVLNSIKTKAPEVIAPEHVASVAVGKKLTYSHHVLSGRAVACGKNVCQYHLSQSLQMYSNHP